MKTNISILFASIFISLSASAAPAILIETTISEFNAKGDRQLLSKPSVVVESGKQASIQIGMHNYSLTPTLLADGTVEIQVVLTERIGGKVHTLAKPLLRTSLDRKAEIQIGQRAFTVEPSLEPKS